MIVGGNGRVHASQPGVECRLSGRLRSRRYVKDATEESCFAFERKRRYASLHRPAIKTISRILIRRRKWLVQAGLVGGAFMAAALRRYTGVKDGQIAQILRIETTEKSFAQTF